MGKELESLGHLISKNSYTHKCGEHGVYEIPFKLPPGASGCPQCAEKLIEQDEVEVMDMLKKQGEVRRFICHDLPDRYRGLRMSSFETPTKDHVNAVDAARRIFTGKTSNLVLIGKTGTGKTHLVAAVCTEWVGAGKGEAKMIKANRLFRQIRETWKGKGSEQEVIDSLVAVDLLVIDDIGAGRNTDDERLLVAEVIGERYDAKRPTIITSNLNREELTETLGDRTVSRLRECGDVVVMNWGDWRTDGGVGGKKGG